VTQEMHSISEFGDTLKKKVIVGSFWLYALALVSKGLIIIQTIVLARLLAPEHFGIVGVFLIVSGALESLTNSGFSKALVQQKVIDNDFLDTAWTVSIVRGGTIFVLLFLLSPLVVGFFNTPKALPVIRVLGLSLLFKGFTNSGTAYFSRNLEFHKQFLWQINGFIANFLISIPLAFILRNEWAIVWGLLASDVVGLIFSFVLHPYRPKLKFNFQVFRILFGYGKWLLFSSIVVFFSKQGDRVFVVRLLGEVGLGVYTIAWRFARMPEILTRPLSKALFPAYSRFQDNPHAIKERYIKSIRVIGLFSVPLVAGIIVLAKPFISVFLGDKWVAATLPMQILTLAVGIDTITYASLPLFNAMGLTVFSFKIACVRSLVLAVLVFPLIKYYGVTGASLCYLVLSLAAFAVWKVEVYRLLKLTLAELYFLVLPCVSTLVMVLALLCFGLMIPMKQASNILAALCLGVVVYFSVGLAIERLTNFGFLRDFVEIIRVLKPTHGITKERT